MLVLVIFCLDFKENLIFRGDAGGRQQQKAPACARALYIKHYFTSEIIIFSGKTGGWVHPRS